MQELNHDTIPIEVRLAYKDVNDKSLVFLMLAIVIVVAFLLLWFFDQIPFEAFSILIFIAPFFAGVYLFRRRLCPNCRKKMDRKAHQTSLYYFCDDCKLKLKTSLDIDE